MTERTRGMELTVKLQVFEGPLDLLLYLLEKNKVNIYDIPIVEITEQYMEYIREMKRQDLEVLSEFLVMAATLIDIKSRMLLPSNPDSEEEEEDPRAELVQQLLEYKMYKYASLELKDMNLDAGKNYYKPATIPKRKDFCKWQGNKYPYMSTGNPAWNRIYPGGPEGAWRISPDEHQMECRRK